MGHSCPEIDKLPEDCFGNHEVYAYGKRLTDGFDFNVQINVDSARDIFVERWKTLNGGITCERKSVKINYCPFCGERVRDESEVEWLPKPDELGVICFGDTGSEQKRSHTDDFYALAEDGFKKGVVK